MAVMLLRSTQFLYPHNRAEPVFLDLRRFHNIKALGGKNAKKFVVSERLPAIDKIINTGFDTKAEAKQFYCERLVTLEDLGMDKMNFTISGFHEED